MERLSNIGGGFDFNSRYFVWYVRLFSAGDLPMKDLRCKKCGKKVAEIKNIESGEISWVCLRHGCKAFNVVKLDNKLEVV